MKDLVIHIADWNMQDRVLTAPRTKAVEIITDASRSATLRMQQVYDLALTVGSVESDPRASEMGNADIFLSWPGEGLGFVSDSNWDAEFAEELHEI